MADLLDTLVPALGWALVHFLWQGALVGVIAAVLLHVLRDARAQTRYAVACLALLACVLVPSITLAMRLMADAAPASATTGWAGGDASLVQFVAAAPVSPWRLDDALPWIVLAWFSGTCALSLRMGLGLLWVQRLRATPQGPHHAAWQARLDALAHRFGMRHVSLRLVDALDSPVSAGWWRPVVFLPTALLARMPVDLVEALLAHELAHIRRHDYAVNLLQNLAEALLFYHPVTWWLSRRIRIEREHIADRLAADVTGEPRRLALALSELSELAHAGHACTLSPHLAQAAHGGHLMSRIEQLVRPGARIARGGVALPLIGLAAVCVAFYAHAQIAPDAKPATKAAPASQPAPQVRATPAPAVQPTAAAKPTPKASVRHTTMHGDSDDAFALVSRDRDRITMNGSTDDLVEIEQARSSLKNQDFIWFRRDGKAYVVSDAATMGKVRDAWVESNRVGQRMEALGDQMEVHGKRMEALGAQMEKLTPPPANEAAMEAASKRMEELAQEQSILAAKQAEAAAGMWRGDENEQRKLTARMDALSQQQETLGRRMEEQSKVMEAHAERMSANSEPMEALGRQMDEASKPMDALGKQMDALGKEQEKVAAEAERKTRAIIDDALAKGLALPAPRYGAL